MSGTKTTTQWEDLPDLITIPELAGYWRTSTGWTYEAARSGFLKPAAVRLGRTIRIRKDVLRELLDSGSLDAR